jgi:hypothetical protein
MGRSLFHLTALAGLGLAMAVSADGPAGAQVFQAQQQSSAQNTLKVVNQCSFDVWLQQDNIDFAPQIVKLGPGGKYTYKINPAGDPSTMVWPKTGCNSQGQNCKVGQTRAPCPATGCMPDFNSRVEATWACVGAGCIIENANTYYDTSQVDGFTYAFKLNATGTVANPACEKVNCNLFSTANCPQHEDLSSGGRYPKYADVDLRARSPANNKVIGCFSPCEKLTAGTSAGGYGYKPEDDQAILYCCPSFGSDTKRTKEVKQACLKGPVPKTDYVNFVHKACRDRAYAWAYDDVDGNHSCSGIVDLVMQICPGGTN